MSAPCPVDLGPAEEVLRRYPAEEASLIQVLQDVHRAYNYLPCDVLVRVAETLHVPLAKVFSVGTFYKAFSLTPQGRTIVKVCTGTACHIRGAVQLLDELCRQLNVEPGGTTQDLGFTVKTVNCVGACAMAPVLIVDETYYGNAAAAKVGKYLKGSGGKANAN
ncbi:MAG: NAD(P)H-dependent oxidoreductase subunit E [Acidobacteriota bacterium]|jgi:NADH-quinone oxidoreductase subunit E